VKQLKSKEQRKPNPLLREQRLLRGWSLQRVVEELCALSSVDERLLGVNAPMVSNWETGTKKPSPFYRERLCKLYNMTADQLGFMDAPVASRGSQLNPLPFDYAMLPYPRPKQPVNSNDILSSQAFIREFTDIEAENITLAHLNRSRRAALVQLLNVAGMTIISSLDLEAWEKLTLASTQPAMMNTGAFNHFQKIIDACWGLCNNGEMQAAEQILASFLPQMIQIAPSHSAAATLAAQGLRLQSILWGHQLKLADMVLLCQQAAVYARQSNDPNTLSAALNGLAVAYKYARQPENSFMAYQEALYYCDQASPLLRSRVYAGAAATFAQRERKQEAYFYIGLAYENLPEHPEDDPNFLSADNGIYMLAYYEGLLYLALNQPKEAERAFESYKIHPSGSSIPERNRLEIINHSGRAAIMSSDLEKYVDCLKDSITGAIALKSKKRFDEAINIYHHDVPKDWLLEPHIKQIDDQFQLGQHKQEG
jgi:transcriptional regulator with XRE-family HTH domain